MGGITVGAEFGERLDLERYTRMALRHMDELECWWEAARGVYSRPKHLSPQGYAGLPDATGEEAVCVRCGKRFTPQPLR